MTTELFIGPGPEFQPLQNDDSRPSFPKIQISEKFNGPMPGEEQKGAVEFDWK
jgi:hypothetical protein